MIHSRILLGALLFATNLGAQAAPKRAIVEGKNALAFRRDDETVAVPWAELQKGFSGLRGDAVRVLDATNHELTSQAVDNDGDGALDELLFKADFAPGESRMFFIEPAAPRQKPVSRVHVRHDEPRDDMAWESDRIAFRIYGEGLKKTSSAMSSSGIDIWVKSTRALITEKWYAKGHDSYHVDTGEGADFYDVGETLGNGGTALWINDSLYRADNFKKWRIIADGPIRAIFELEYDPWGPAALQVRETKRFAIDAGDNLYRQVSTFRVVNGTATRVPYVIGTLKRAGMVGTMSKANQWAWLTGWGPVSKKNGGHGEMGSAVMLPSNRVASWQENDQHYLAVTQATSGEPAVHYIGAGWTDSGDFRLPQDWWSYLDRFAQRLASPIAISYVATGAAR